MENKYFYCYSCAMKDFIKSQDINYITKGLHPKSGRPYFMFEKNEKLDIAIQKWKNFRLY